MRARFVQCRKQQPPLPRPLTAHAFRAAARGDDTHARAAGADGSRARTRTSVLARSLACRRNGSEHAPTWRSDRGTRRPLAGRWATATATATACMPHTPYMLRNEPTRPASQSITACRGADGVHPQQPRPPGVSASAGCYSLAPTTGIRLRPACYSPRDMCRLVCMVRWSSPARRTPWPVGNGQAGAAPRMSGDESVVRWDGGRRSGRLTRSSSGVLRALPESR